MIVYREQQETVDSFSCVRGMTGVLRRRGYAEHEDAVRLLIDLGEFETAVADALGTEANLVTPITGLLRQMSLLAGHLFYWSWMGSADNVALWAARLEQVLEKVAALPLPKTLEVRVSEGYAYYSLAPETYLEAAAKFRRDVGQVRAVCIGIRSIGTSLSAVVAAALEEHGCRVESYTVRCHGHPFDRRVQFDPATTEKIRLLRNRHYLIVDEGPGLSGSTLCCVADRLSEFGVPDSRIAFFPGHDVDAAKLFSEKARSRWLRHRKYLVDFDEVWVRNGRLTQSLPEGRLTDISAGMWRPLVFKDESAYPAVQPWHERRKYLYLKYGAKGEEPDFAAAISPAQPQSHSTPLLLKFAGFGRYGESTYARAALLARAGFHPPVLGLSHGFLVMEFVHGEPMRRRDIDRLFLDHVARYLARLNRIPATAVQMSPDELMHMIEVNVAEGLGPRWLARLRRAGLSLPSKEHPTGITDGRMLLHEWLRTTRGYVKTDGVDHYTDHFSPGCGDAAWDIAACIAEWDLSPSLRNYLIGQYVTATGDTGLKERLRFYRLAYLAHRLGYATMAAQGLGAHSADGKRFETLARGYSGLLKRDLSRS